ncbi:bidirectional sugar transporter NEC1-like [Silene latifolia]|uniref:bidirectional sugar transporter NEC1-like n=1 Tax=Silene latifolia TaxID=37657 RepID=UPI003D76FEB5
MALTSLQHHELVFIFGILGNVVSFGVYLAPLPTFWRVFKKKSTEGFQSIPYSVALFSAMLLLYYAFIKEYDGTMIITINSIGVAIEGFYLTVYLIYAPKKAKVYTAKLLGLFNVGFLGLIVISTMWFVRGGDEHRWLSKGGMRETVIGWICAVFSVCVFAAPLSVMRMVIRTKSVEFMPFWLSFSLTLCAVMWFFYGFLIKDFYIALPNILGFAFGITQMILYIIYKDSSKKKNIGIKEDNNITKLEDLAVKIDRGEVIEVIIEGKVNYEDGKENGKNKIIGKIIRENKDGEKSLGTCKNVTENAKGDSLRGENNV